MEKEFLGKVVSNPLHGSEPSGAVDMGTVVDRGSSSDHEDAPTRAPTKSPKKNKKKKHQKQKQKQKRKEKRKHKKK